MRISLKLISVLLFMLVANFIFAQRVNVTGKIYVANTKEEVSYANIAIADYPVGTTSDIHGSFTLDLSQEHLNSKLWVSSLNYYSVQFSIDSLVRCDTVLIFLEKQSYEMAEVVISKKKKVKPLVLNKLKSSQINGYILCDNIPKIYARYFPFESGYGFRNNVTELSIGCQGTGSGRGYKIRLRFLKKEPNVLIPGRDILRDELIVEVKPGINKIDLSAYAIKIPVEGLFVAIEWLIIEENQYDWIWYDENDKKNVETKYGPILGATYVEEPMTFEFWAGEWNNYSYEVPMVHPKIKPNTFFDAAISVTISE